MAAASPLSRGVLYSGGAALARIAALAILFMTLLIQRAEHRDTQAIHAKLDELLRASGEARDELAWLDDKEPETIERLRQRARARDQSG